MGNPIIDVVMAYSKNLDLWALDIRLNKEAETLLARFKCGEKTSYELPNGKTRARYLMKNQFAGTFGTKKDFEKYLLAALFDVSDFGSGKRTTFAGDYMAATEQLIYLKELFKVIANHSGLLDRKVVAKITIGKNED